MAMAATLTEGSGEEGRSEDSIGWTSWREWQEGPVMCCARHCCSRSRGIADAVTPSRGDRVVMKEISCPVLASRQVNIVDFSTSQTCTEPSLVATCKLDGCMGRRIGMTSIR